MKKLILVDDDEFVLEQLESSIDWDQHGFECVGTFTDGTDALAYISSMPVDAVITDIKMPNHTGIDIASSGIRGATISAISISYIRRNNKIHSSTSIKCMT